LYFQKPVFQKFCHFYNPSHTYYLSIVPDRDASIETRIGLEKWPSRKSRLRRRVFRKKFATETGKRTWPSSEEKSDIAKTEIAEMFSEIKWRFSVTTEIGNSYRPHHLLQVIACARFTNTLFTKTLKQVPSLALSLHGCRNVLNKTNGYNGTKLCWTILKIIDFHFWKFKLTSIAS